MFHVRRVTNREEVRIGVFYNTQLIATMNVYMQPDSKDRISIEVINGMSEMMALWDDYLEDKISAD